MQPRLDLDGTILPPHTPPVRERAMCDHCEGRGYIVRENIGHIKWTWVGKWWKPWTWEKYAWVYDKTAPMWYGEKAYPPIHCERGTHTMRTGERFCLTHASVMRDGDDYCDAVQRAHEVLAR